MSTDTLESRAPELLVQLVRTLRVAAVHDLSNDAAIQVSNELRARLDEDLALFSAIALQISGESVYINGEFVKLRGAAYDAAIQARQLYERLGINELKITAPLDARELRALLAAVQASLHSQHATDFAKLTFPKIVLRPITDAHRVGIDERVALAKSYAQLVVILQESTLLLARDKPIALARIRRALHEVLRASERLRPLLAGLTRFDELTGDPAQHCAAVAALTMLMGLELGMARRHVVSLGMSAALHHLPPDEGSAALIAARIAAAMPGLEIIERVSVVLEAAAPELAGKDAIIPSIAARCVGTACAFDRMSRGGADARALRPDHALRLLIESAGVRHDPRVVRLLTRVVGLYPVGTMVRLSGGQIAVVLAAPADDGPAARPTVRVIEEKGRAVSYVLELARESAHSIVESVDAKELRLNAVHFLMA